MGQLSRRAIGYNSEPAAKESDSLMEEDNRNVDDCRKRCEQGRRALSVQLREFNPSTLPP